jgi:glycosyltransferase involved in cell wall biosynthesis
VHLAGRLDRATLRSLYHAADVFASASTNEGFGLVYLEAMACSLPVVARPVGVVPELVDEGADVLVAYNVDGFARALETALGHEAPDNERLAERYDWDRVLDRWEAVYREVAP